MTRAEQLLAAIGDDDIQLLRKICSREYKMFVRMKDGRQRFQFSDGSYLDILPIGDESTMEIV